MKAKIITIEKLQEIIVEKAKKNSALEKEVLSQAEELATQQTKVLSQAEELASQAKELASKKTKVLSQAKELKEQQSEINYLKEKLDYLLRQKFTSKSEKLNSNQPSLFDEIDQPIQSIEDEEIEIAFKRKKKGRTTPPKELPRVIVEHDINEEDKICSCGNRMHRIKGIVSEQYDIVPATFRVIQNVRYVYGCRCGLAPVTTPLAPFILPKTQVTASFLSTIVVQKCEDALPLHRQAKIYKNRFGVPFTDTTLSDWVIKASIKLAPFTQRLKGCLLENEYIQADETTLQVTREHKGKPTKKSYIWLGVGADKHKVVYMHYANNRTANVPSMLFKGFNGYLQTDGYQGYNHLVQTEGITQLACWAHARRKFADIIKSGVSDTKSKTYAKEVVSLIRRLYKIEKEIKEDPPDIKCLIRKERSKPIIDNIREWLDSNFLEAQKLGGSIAKAFVYLNNQFAKLCIYLEDGRLHIDNNRAENHIRPIVLGRKNWLFATSVKGAEAIAVWYTIIETAKANGLDPYHYLEYLLTEFPYYMRDNRDIGELLPWNVEGIRRLA